MTSYEVKPYNYAGYNNYLKDHKTKKLLALHTHLFDVEG